MYTLIAGLLNVLAIYDAWGGPVFMEKKEEDEKSGARATVAKEPLKRPERPCPESIRRQEHDIAQTAVKASPTPRLPRRPSTSNYRPS